MGTLRQLSQSPVFEGLSAEAIDRLCGQGRAVSFAAGHPLFERGQDADELMILRDGVIELSFPVRILGVTRELTLDTKQPGDVVAWSALVRPYHFTLSARCASACVLTRFDRQALNGFFEAHPDVGYLFMRNLAGVIGQRLQAMQAIWLRDLQASAVRRLE